MAREHTVRAAGADRSFQKFILVKKTTPKSGCCKGEKKKNDDTSTAARFRGVPDAGITGASAPSNYFILIKDKGSDDFLAIPVSEWATFKAIQRRSQLSLEDAEAQMKFRRLQAERANPRIAQAIGDDDVEAGSAAAAAAAAAAAGGGGDADEVDSDDEWKDIKARAASLAAMRAKAVNNGNKLAAGGNNKNNNQDDDGGDDAEALGIDSAVYVPKPRDAEDWEHEGEAADDDLDMGGGSDAEVDVSPARAPAFSDSDGEGDMDASKVKKAIKRMMKETGLEESEGSEMSSQEDRDEEEDEEEEEEEDVEDLDRMASEVLPSAAAAAAALAGGGGEAGGRKRKSPPRSALEKPAGPPTLTGITPVSQAVEDAAVAATAAKKARFEAAIPSPPVSPSAATGPPTEAEIIGLLTSRGRMLLKDLSSAFMGRLKTKEERQNFSKLVKKVVKLLPEDSQGNKFVVLK
ncbi:hypothetical protein Ndes2526A_g01291 [Nannochloris sp. 'desiccata']